MVSAVRPIIFLSVAKSLSYRPSIEYNHSSLGLRGKKQDLYDKAKFKFNMHGSYAFAMQ